MEGFVVSSGQFCRAAKVFFLSSVWVEDCFVYSRSVFKRVFIVYVIILGVIWIFASLLSVSDVWNDPTLLFLSRYNPK